MRKKKQAPDQSAEDGAVPAPDKGGRGRLLPSLVVAIGLVSAAFVMRGGDSSAASMPAGETATTTTAPPEPGATVALDPITLNLADGHLLKVGVALLLSADSHLGYDDHGKPVEPRGAFAAALDLLIADLGGRTYDQLVTPEGRDKAKQELRHQLQETYEGEVIDLYFTDFVMP